MLLQVTHNTHYRYTPAVETAQHVAYLQPLNHPGQTLLEHQLTVQPQPAQMQCMADVYGNVRCFLSLQTPHEVLSVVAQSRMSTAPSPPVESTIAWENAREQLRYRAGWQYDPAAEFVFASPYVPRHPEFALYAAKAFSAGADLLQATIALTDQIHHDFAYESQSTQVNTPALQALHQRKGVCQDFSHIMIACLRTLGLPARYVSGYLLTEPPPGEIKLIGSDASHAWVSVYLPDLPPGQRWVDFDPTNNRWGWHAPGADYVTVATGRDFGDVSPLRGVIHGGASHVLTVGVTVEPFSQNSAFPSVQTQTQIQT